jgi:hypothetical protein
MVSAWWIVSMRLLRSRFNKRIAFGICSQSICISNYAATISALRHSLTRWHTCQAYRLSNFLSHYPWMHYMERLHTTRQAYLLKHPNHTFSPTDHYNGDPIE